jgi:hypothetical protein
MGVLSEPPPPREVLGAHRGISRVGSRVALGPSLQIISIMTAPKITKLSSQHIFDHSITEQRFEVLGLLLQISFRALSID